MCVYVFFVILMWVVSLQISQSSSIFEISSSTLGFLKFLWMPSCLWNSWGCLSNFEILACTVWFLKFYCLPLTYLKFLSYTPLVFNISCSANRCCSVTTRPLFGSYPVVVHPPFDHSSSPIGHCSATIWPIVVVQPTFGRCSPAVARLLSATIVRSLLSGRYSATARPPLWSTPLPTIVGPNAMSASSRSY